MNFNCAILKLYKADRKSNDRKGTMMESVIGKINESAIELSNNYKKQKVFNTSIGGKLPDRDIIISIVDELRSVTFPGFFGKDKNIYVTKESFADGKLSGIYEKLSRQIKIALLHGNSNQSYEDIKQKAEGVSLAFIETIPKIQEKLLKDVEAGFDGDPAAKSEVEIIFSYPGLFAIFVYRYANVLYKAEVPFIPRIMTEYAHSQTGIDINPGAEIGEYFFIDHGTGIVIGETTIIGEHVKIYQGVTLGALSTREGQKLAGKKRHPTIEDNVVIYANTTVLGGDTVVGKNSVIAGNTFITNSVPPNTKVATTIPELEVKNKNTRGEQ